MRSKFSRRVRRDGREPKTLTMRRYLNVLEQNYDVDASAVATNEVSNAPTGMSNVRRRIRSLLETNARFRDSVHSAIGDHFEDDLQRKTACPVSGTCSATAQVDAHIFDNSEDITFDVTDGFATARHNNNNDPTRIVSVPIHLRRCDDGLTDCSRATQMNRTGGQYMLRKGIDDVKDSYLLEMDDVEYLLENTLQATSRNACPTLLCEHNTDACPPLFVVSHRMEIVCPNDMHDMTS